MSLCKRETGTVVISKKKLQVDFDTKSTEVRQLITLSIYSAFRVFFSFCLSRVPLDLRRAWHLPCAVRKQALCLSVKWASANCCIGHASVFSFLILRKQMTRIRLFCACKGVARGGQGGQSHPKSSLRKNCEAKKTTYSVYNIAH